ncbi:hypothetical protein K431DRAFT_140806 [Polychaeton citri CBS 116435]|uniref:Uncharacterized protein n=1 Tax=Polychaeton citri CBS 116435 TaxID=1314669 RepID=A0A9P4Q4H1_9PEZI|nr:hypothetical protein K431DRAFT_140806 [Polychaeton citri CBS 116435]
MAHPPSRERLPPPPISISLSHSHISFRLLRPRASCVPIKGEISSAESIATLHRPHVTCTHTVSRPESWESFSQIRPSSGFLLMMEVMICIQTMSRLRSRLLFPPFALRGCGCPPTFCSFFPISLPSGCYIPVRLRKHPTTAQSYAFALA